MQSETTSLFLRGMPRRLVREAKSASAREGTTLAAFVTKALEHTLGGAAGSQSEPGAGLDADTRWFEENRPRLLSRYAGRYVAIVDRRVVDDDANWEKLARRVFERFGVRPILMPRVEAGPRVARLRSPRRAQA
jgi:hypothetical protein